MSKQAKSKDNLETMRLPELQARYQEVIGEATRTPNKSFLIRRIREALAAKPAEKVASKPAPAQKARGKRQTKEQAPAATQGLLAPLLGVLKRGAAPSAGQREPAPRAASARPRSTEAQSPTEPATETVAPRKPPRGRFRSMTIEELQTMYLEVVGRSTGSDNRSYVEPVNMGSQRLSRCVFPRRALKMTPHIRDVFGGRMTSRFPSPEACMAMSAGSWRPQGERA